MTRYRTLVEDREDDDEYGPVTHPIGSTFVLGDEVNPGEHEALWENAVDAKGNVVPAEGMCTIWTNFELRTQAVEVSEGRPA